MGATSVIRANECRAAPSARARETGRASASAMGLLTPPCSRRALNRRDLRKQFFETFFEEPVERVTLKLIRLGMGATSLVRANECRAAPPPARPRETGRSSASAIGLFSYLRVRGDHATKENNDACLTPTRRSPRLQALRFDGQLCDITWGLRQEDLEGVHSNVEGNHSAKRCPR